MPDWIASRDLDRISARLHSEWISETTLHRLEQLGLSVAGVDKILGWMINRQVPLPKEKPSPGTALFAVHELLYPDRTRNLEQLAVRSESLYRYHNRSLWLGSVGWIDWISWQ